MEPSIKEMPDAEMPDEDAADAGAPGLACTVVAAEDAHERLDRVLAAHCANCRARALRR